MEQNYNRRPVRWLGESDDEDEVDTAALDDDDEIKGADELADAQSDEMSDDDF